MSLWIRLFGVKKPKKMVDLSEDDLQKLYLEVGGAFGDAMSYSYMGRPIEHDEMLERWAAAEREWARRGKRAISLDQFTDYGGYSQPIEGLGDLREEAEDVVLHAEIYRQVYCGGDQPSAVRLNPVELAFKTGKPQIGTYLLPSTKAFVSDK